jgi:hypothetical protein
MNESERHMRDSLQIAKRAYVARQKRSSETTLIRAYRLARNVTLTEAALASGISTRRVSLIERDPSIARDGEIERLRAAIDAVADHSSAVAS